MAPYDDKINSKTSQYDEMAANWVLIHDLLGGTRAMREANVRWLPMEPKEQTSQYERRLGRSFLYNGYKDTVRKISSRPFMKPVLLRGEESLDPQLVPIKEDVDGTGKDLTQFGRDAMKAGVTYGLGHVLVDFPQMRGDETLEEERKLVATPRFVFIPPTELWGWQTLNGELLQIRIHEERSIPKPPFGAQKVEFIRLFTSQEWQLWQKAEEDSNFELVDEGTHTFGKVPLVTFYFDQTGEFQGEPPLMDLAWMNLAHWQSLSDQRNILRFARMGILYALGLKEEEKRRIEAFGPSSFITSTNDKASVGYAEHSGKAVAAGEYDLEKLEKRMESLGMAPFLDRATHSTATGITTNESKGNSDMKAWLRSLENALKQCYEMAARWTNKELPEDFCVEISENFEILNRPSTDLDLLQKVRAAGDISRELLITEMQRRGVIGDNKSVEDIIAEIEDEGPSLSFMGGGEEPPTQRSDKKEEVNAA